MALEKSGVQLVVEGLGTFQGDLQKASQAEKGFGDSAVATGGKLDGVNKKIFDHAKAHETTSISLGTLAKGFIGISTAIVGATTAIGAAALKLASDAAISPTVIFDFLSGKRDIHLTTADRLARSLGLEVTAE